jgi:hypothetical protein
VHFQTLKRDIEGQDHFCFTAMFSGKAPHSFG